MVSSKRLPLYLLSPHPSFLRDYWCTHSDLSLLNSHHYCSMDFSFISFVIMIRRFVGLLLTPYKTMRKIAIEGEYSDLTWIYFFSSLYFFLSGNIRMELWGIITMIILTLFSVGFFSLLPSRETIPQKWKTVWLTWSHTLFPTIIWFYTTLVFYLILPPPRTISLLGKAFSIFYIGFSVSLLAWKLILVYLSIRFSLRVHIYRVLYYFILYLALSIPLWVLLYRLGISRIPFV